MSKKYVIANFKMNKTDEEVVSYIEKFKEMLTVVSEELMPEARIK